MNQAHLHLLLNHIPILGSLGGALILLYGIFSKNIGVQKVALTIFIISALVAIPVFMTGEPTEEIVEDLAGVNKSMIEEHEETAKIAIWLIEALGILSLLSFILQAKGNALAKAFMNVTLLLSLIAFGLIAKAGYEGGKIRHVEITNSAQSGATHGGESEDD